MTRVDETANPYRWIVLLNYALIQAVMQMLWITFAPITGDAAEFYGVSALQIGFLAMSFMIVYIFVSFPASWAIDTFGIRKGVGFGVVLTGIFGILRGFMGNDYTYVMISMIGLAVAQPFILNSVTSLSAKWFPLRERATAAGLAIMAQFVGIVIGMAATPLLTIQFGIPGMLKIYGVISMVGAICFFLFIKPDPELTKEAAGTPRTKVFEGLRHIFKLKDMIIMIILIFIGLGIFNAITTWIEQMIAPRGFSIVQAGTLGAVLMAGGILGCLVVPALSDRLRKRKLPVVVCLIGSLPGLIGLTFVTSFGWLLASGFLMGFFFMSIAPVAFQYGTEISYPAPEATSQGVLMLAGQISGIIFIFGMDMFRTESGSMTPFLLVMIGLWALTIFLSFMLRESSMIEASEEEK
ncbi:MAG: MFS transporter [Deltaproteobacteria bacterium]|nr:MFS transporter [Deltaproteobacteria bacterium]